MIFSRIFSGNLDFQIERLPVRESVSEDIRFPFIADVDLISVGGKKYANIMPSGDVSTLIKVVDDIVKAWGGSEFVPVREAQEALGLPVTDMGEYMGWDTDDLLDVNGDMTLHFTITSEWMDLPWGRETVGVVRFTPWPINI